MILSNKEKEEILEDGYNTNRRKEFTQGKKNQKGISSLDEYIKFLMSIQKIFPPFEISHKKTITKFNKL